MYKPRTGLRTQELRTMDGAGPRKPRSFYQSWLVGQGIRRRLSSKTRPHCSNYLAGRTWCAAPAHSCRASYYSPQVYIGNQAWATARKGTREEKWGVGEMWSWGAQTQADQGAGVKGE